MGTHHRLVGLLFVGLVGCQQASPGASSLPAERSLQRDEACGPGSFETNDLLCDAKRPGGTPGPDYTATGNFDDGCVSGLADANHYCTLADFGSGDCNQTSQCAGVLDLAGRQAGCDPTMFTCSVPGCGPGSYVGADGLCYDKVVGGGAAPGNTQSGTPGDGCVGGSATDGVCNLTATGSGDCWFDSQCSDVATDSSASIGCMANHHCGPTTCAAGYYVTASGTCSPKIPGGTPAPLDTLSESDGGPRSVGCVSGVGDANNYCVPPAFGAGDCATTSQCTYVSDSDGRDAGCDPTAHTCSVSGCGAGSYVGTDGLCHDKVASGGAGPSDVADGNPADGCVSGALAGVDCAGTQSGTGDCWSASQCDLAAVESSVSMGCMANHSCGPTSCAAGYYITSSGTCALKISGGTPAPLDTLSESLGGPRSVGCVSGASDPNNYCVAPAFGAGDCTQDAQCAYVFSNNAPLVFCDPSAHTCSVCQSGTYQTAGAGCSDKVAGSLPAPTDTSSGDPASGCVSGAVDGDGNCTTPSAPGGDCYMNSQCGGVVATGAIGVSCDFTAHACVVVGCTDGFYMANGTCTACTVCQPGERRNATCTATSDATCVSCAPGTFSNDTNVDTCNLCPVDTFATGGADSCTACDAGAHALQGANACTHCALGSAFEDGTCSTCDAGTYAADGDTSCTQCTAGTYSSAGAASCTACDPGSYAGAGASACILCAPDTYADTAGASTCRSCAAGSHAPDPGAIVCAQCPSGQYLSGDTCVACTVCAFGRQRQQACTTTTDTVCAPCTAGTYANVTNSDTCTTCPANTFAGAGAASCTPCDAGSHAAPGSSSCSQCDPGDVYAGGICSACNAGSAAADGETNCLTCAAGTFAAAGVTSCTACAPGHRSDSGASSCTACAAGTFAATAGAITCQTCPAGTTSDAGATECTPCADGTYAAAGASSCTACTSCDDGNDCTTDSCNATRGCTHVSTCASGDQSSTSTSATADLGTGIPTVSGGCAALTPEPELWLALALLVVLRRRAKAQ